MNKLELEQLLVDAAAVIEDMTDDLDEDGDGARDLAGRLRDAAAVLRAQQDVFLAPPHAQGDKE